MSEATYTPGAFVWRELMTPDVQKAKGFYGELFGWTYHEADMGDFVYPMIKVGEKMIGGMMEMKDAPHPPHWMSYVSVNDVDASAAAAKANGGQVAVGPMDIPNVGRFAVIGDPDGAYLSAFKSAQGDPPYGMPSLHTFCWETLVTKDVERAKAFYGAVTGWKTVAGPGGSTDMPVFGMSDQMQVADIQEARNMPPSWATYVVVEKLEPARDKAARLGANIVMPLIEIPNVGRIAFFADPTGAHLGLYESAMG